MTLIVQILVMALIIICLRFILEIWLPVYQGFKWLVLRCRVDLRKYGQWAVVTGCTDGIGRAYAKELARKGLNIVLISRNLKKLENVRDEIDAESKVQVKMIVKDFSCNDKMDDIKEELKHLDIGILVNNVGIANNHPDRFCNLPEENHRQLIQININTAVFLTYYLLPAMASRKRGIIINICSGCTQQPIPFANLYAASKKFLYDFSEALRWEYRHAGIEIQTLTPFFVSTMINHFSEDLRRVNLFIPTPDTYVKSAVSTIGVLDSTTGYLPHSFHYGFMALFPTWLRSFICGVFYKNVRNTYFKTVGRTKDIKEL